MEEAPEGAGVMVATGVMEEATAETVVATGTAEPLAVTVETGRPPRRRQTAIRYC